MNRPENSRKGRKKAKMRQQRIRAQKLQKQQYEKKRDAEAAAIKAQEDAEIRSVGGEPEPEQPTPRFKGFRPGVIPPNVRKKMEEDPKDDDDLDMDIDPDLFITGQQ